jgi:hypothetical protein
VALLIPGCGSLKQGTAGADVVVEQPNGARRGRREVLVLSTRARHHDVVHTSELAGPLTG